jgi:hypothetical protein
VLIVFEPVDDSRDAVFDQYLSTGVKSFVNSNLRHGTGQISVN